MREAVDADRLIEADQGGAAIFTAAYDAATNRLATIEGGAGSTSSPQATLFRYDDGTNFQELSATGVVNKELIRAGGLGGGIGSILYSDESMAATPGPVENFTYDAVGNTVALTNATGTPTQTTLYGAFGDTLTQTGTSDNNRLHNTKERDASIGLDDYGMRYYDSATGSFINRDPSSYSDGPDVYIFVHANPANAVDPNGEYAQILLGAGIGAAAGAIGARLVPGSTWKDVAAGALGGAVGGGLISTGFGASWAGAASSATSSFAGQVLNGENPLSSSNALRTLTSAVAGAIIGKFSGEVTGSEAGQLMTEAAAWGHDVLSNAASSFTSTAVNVYTDAARSALGAGKGLMNQENQQLQQQMDKNKYGPSAQGSPPRPTTTVPESASTQPADSGDATLKDTEPDGTPVYRVPEMTLLPPRKISNWHFASGDRRCVS